MLQSNNNINNYVWETKRIAIEPVEWMDRQPDDSIYEVNWHNCCFRHSLWCCPKWPLMIPGDPMSSIRLNRIRALNVTWKHAFVRIHTMSSLSYNKNTNMNRAQFGWSNTNQNKSKHGHFVPSGIDCYQNLSLFNVRLYCGSFRSIEINDKNQNSVREIIIIILMWALNLFQCQN